VVSGASDGGVGPVPGAVPTAVAVVVDPPVDVVPPPGADGPGPDPPVDPVLPVVAEAVGTLVSGVADGPVGVGASACVEGEADVLPGKATLPPISSTPEALPPAGACA
jgi:hypothetical protein